MKEYFKFILARIAAWILRRIGGDPRYVPLWENAGLDIVPRRYDSPVPDSSALVPGYFKEVSPMRGVRMNADSQVKFLRDIILPAENDWKSWTDRAPREAGDGVQNLSFSLCDGAILYGVVRKLKPGKVIEIGSGFSTLVTASALSLNSSEGFHSQLTAIEPWPRPFLKSGTPYPIGLIEEPVQKVHLPLFESLSVNDILFIDSTHVLKAASDVKYEFLEILPVLAPGVVVHIHDIFLPGEYPMEWIVKERRHWNEQYLLQAFLCHNSRVQVLWAGAWMFHHHRDKVLSELGAPDGETPHSVSFWIRILPG